VIAILTVMEAGGGIGGGGRHCARICLIRDV
jgi:hypothetical protein